MTSCFRTLVSAFLATLVLTISFPAAAHGSDSHEDKPVAAATEPLSDSAAPETSAASATQVMETEAIPSNEPEALRFLRSLHPATVHFPIAFFLLAGLLETLAVFRRRGGFGSSVDVLIVAGTVGAVVATIFGWIHTGVWFGGDAPMQWHRWTGTGVAFAGLALLPAMRFKSRGLLRVLLACVCGALVLQGYLGGELAHGSNHLM